ncbi:ABC transporter permease [Algoriphagus sp. CAU 1675]|uniref:ABC transporter permease n=1 Tax=Algoriphagus sp. CAU 1675 TaxID=3032597 RepID=UPI0023DCBDA5|nr:ABC transporter permease [Algoriphagus sp. CAU 1675]MDF2158127.1 ABC transporter permease [Algoriphagus sp. CAU 1675]
MLKNYFKIAFRNILRNRVRTIIHVLGLAMGISICFLIFNVVWHAHSFDRFHPDGDQIFRVMTTTDFGAMKYSSPGAPGPLGEVLRDEVAGVEQSGRLYTLYQTLIALPESNQVFGRENHVTFADEGFFRLFPREWLSGNPKEALSEPNQVVITEESMKSYFPGLSPAQVLGKEMLFVDVDSIFVTVSGVVSDFKENTELTYREFISYVTAQRNKKESLYNLGSWNNVNSSSQLFFKKNPEAQVESLKLGLRAIEQKYYADQEEDGKTTFDFESLYEMHFSDSYSNGGISKALLKGLLVVGGIILVLACLNFINLETAHAIGRAKEVGIRKTLGGGKSQLVFQFLAETYLMVLIAALLGVILSELIFKTFQSYLPQNFTMDYFSGNNFLFLFLFTVGITLIAGIYPSLVLSNYQPHRALKGEKVMTGKFSIGVFLRKNLSILQFSSSIAFIILVLIVSFQIRYVTSHPVGFNNDMVVYSYLPFRSGVERATQLRERLAQKSYILGSSLSGDPVSSTGLWTSDISVPKDTTELKFFTQVKNIDSSFIAVNGLNLLSGRNLGDHSSELLVNQQFLKEVGWKLPEEAVGKQVDFGGKSQTIVGVVNDFNSSSLKVGILPMVLIQNPEYQNVISAKLAEGRNLSEMIESLKAEYLAVYPYETPDFKFLDLEMNRFYEEDFRIRNVLGFACFLALLISGMGLFGLSSFTITQRMKEISVRKVLGASLFQILSLISKDYILLIGISFLLASIPTYYLSREYLNGFNYKIDMPYLLFVIGGLSVLILCLVIVGVHSLAAAKKNPAKVLKDE